MFEPMAMNQQQFGALPSARRSSTAQSVASALINNMGKKKDAPPETSGIDTNKDGMVATGAPAWAPDEGSDPYMLNDPSTMMAAAPPAWAPKEDAPAPSQVDNKLDDPIMTQQPDVQFSSGDKPFEAADMTNQFGSWGPPEKRKYGPSVDSIISAVAAFA